MKKFMYLVTAAACSALLAQPACAAGLKSLTSNGMDGGVEYFSFSCDNGVEGRLWVYSKPPRYCVSLMTDAKPVCRNIWQPKDAATYRCRTAQPPAGGAGPGPER